MIFVTIGTTHFNALVQAMDEVSLNLDEDVIIQIGRGTYTPKHCQYIRFAPSLAPYYEKASVIVSHGGVGIVTEVIKLGCRLVGVENPDQPARHQREILDVMAKNDHLIWCQDLQKLPQAIQEAKLKTFKPYKMPKTTIGAKIIEFLG